MKIKTCLYKPTGHWKSFCTVSIQLFQQCCSVILKSPYQPAVEYEQADVSTADNVRITGSGYNIPHVNTEYHSYFNANKISLPIEL
ncbi:hypothetical protein T4D_2979 [Trichinella pseudospiralis]|uniref:Uncharacterized protein n=1 Tax=Trichinella pseudospiralis TaxID=6337 RepID=A0A0V1F7K4_TRIPS|nr:hypothetical protein T4D_2979 [Trichinella pseudospiralis]